MSPAATIHRRASALERERCTIRSVPKAARTEIANVVIKNMVLGARKNFVPGTRMSTKSKKGVALPSDHRSEIAATASQNQKSLRRKSRQPAENAADASRSTHTPT